jgi:hypothetical protein
MSAAPASHLRLAHSAPPIPVVVVTDPADLPATGDALLILDALGLDDRTSRSRLGSSRLVVQLGLPGIGARYLTGVARAAALGGWGAPELAALVIELERRCAYVVVAQTTAILVPRRRPAIGPQRRQAVRFDRTGWFRVRADGALFDREMRSAQGRGYTFAAARSGDQPRWVSRELARLSARGVRVGAARPALAPVLGAGWAVELLAAPPVGSHQLQTLRDRFASASRCDWCGLPVIGRHCRRCTPGDGS